MPNQYRSIFPLSQRATYEADSNVDFVLSLNQEKLIPGTVTLEGEVAVYSDINTLPPTQYNGEDIRIDPLVGFHALCRDWTTEFANSGVIENYSNYPRAMKMATVATQHDDSLATESNLACEGRAATEGITRGLLFGRSLSDSFIPFSIVPQIVVNRASAPMSSNTTGQIRLRLRLAPVTEVLYGNGVTSSAGYSIKNLKLRFQTVPDDGKTQTVQMEVKQCFRSNIDSTNQNVSTFVPALCSNVQMSFINQAKEGSIKNNYLQLAPLVGLAPIGAVGNELILASDSYGIEKLTFAINDTDSGAVVDFTFESREEIVRNGLRAFSGKMDKYNAMIRHFNNPEAPDRYIAGISFGNLIDFSRNKFAVEIQSQCGSTAATAFVGYFYFTGLMTITA
jgi:hypothetical protein